MIRACVQLQVVFVIFGASYMQLLPALAVDTLRLGAVEFSWLIGAGGLGAFVGAVTLASSGAIRRRGVLMLASMLSSGALVLGLGLQRELTPALVILVLIGILQQFFFGTQSMILTLAAPDRLRGRVIGIQSVTFHAAGPVGVFTLGTLGTFFGTANAFVFGGGVVIVMAVVAFLRMTAIRDLTNAAEVAPALALANVEAGPAD